MNLYVVRWPNLKASVVRARDEDELYELLSDVADPGGCSWQLYDGPMWIDFHPAAEVTVRRREPRHLDDYIVDVSRFEEDGPLEVSTIGVLPTPAAMIDAVCKAAFPALSHALERNGDAERAVRAELAADNRAHWRILRTVRAGEA